MDNEEELKADELLALEKAINQPEINMASEHDD
jgi:hypothetical protein